MFFPLLDEGPNGRRRNIENIGSSSGCFYNLEAVLFLSFHIIKHNFISELICFGFFVYTD